MPIGSTMSVIKTDNALRLLSQGELISTVRPKFRPSSTSISQAETLSLRKLALKIIFCAGPLFLLTDGSGNVITDSNGNPILVGNASPLVFVTKGISRRTNIPQPHFLLITGGGGRTLAQIAISAHAQTLRLFKFVGKRLVFTTRLSPAATFVQFANILQGQAVKLFKSTARRVALIQQGNVVPIIGQLNRAAIQTALFASTEVLTALGNRAGRLIAMVSAQTFTVTRRNLAKIIRILSPQSIIAQRVIAHAIAIIHTSSQVIDNVIIKRLIVNPTSGILTLAKTRSRTLTMASAELFTIVRKNLTKLVRVLSAQAVTATKPFASLILVAWAQLLSVTFPTTGARQQNVLVSLISPQAWTMRFVDFHFVIINALHPIITTFNHVTDKRAFTFSNFPGLLATPNSFTGPGFNASRAVSATSFRTIVPISQVVIGTGNQVAITFSNVRTPSAGPCEIVQAFIGMQGAPGNDYDFDGAQVQVTFGGKGNGTVPLSGTLTSDFINFAPTANNEVVIAVDIASTGAGLDANLLTTDTAFRAWTAPYAGNTSGNTIGPTGMTQLLRTLIGVSAITKRVENVAVAKAVTKSPFAVPFGQFAQAVKTLSRFTALAVTQAETFTKTAIRARNQGASAVQSAAITIGSAISKLIAFGYVFAPRQFSPAFNVNTTIAQVVRQVIPTSQLLMDSTNPVSVSFSNRFGSTACDIVEAFIGEQGSGGDAAFDGNQVRLTVRGQNFFSIAPGTVVATDPVALSINNDLPLIVSWEVDGTVNSFDALQNVDAGFHFWIGGPSGSAGGTAQPPPPLALQTGILGAVASVGAPPVTTLTNTTGHITSVLSGLLTPLFKKAQPILSAGIGHQLRTGPTVVNKIVPVIHTHVAAILRGMTRLIVSIHAASLVTVRRASPAILISAAQAVANLMNRARVSNFVSPQALVQDSTVNKLIPLFETILVVLPQFANRIARVITFGTAQSIVATKAMSSALTVLHNASQLILRVLVKNLAFDPMGQTVTTARRVGTALAIPWNSVLLFAKAAPKKFTMTSANVLTFVKSNKAKLLVVSIQQAQTVVMALPSFATKVVLNFVQTQAVSVFQASRVVVFRIIKGAPASRNITKGDPTP